MSKEKIKSIKEIEKICEEFRKKNKKIVTTNGVFDILHIGHIRYLEEAKKQGDILIIGLNSDYSVRKNKGPKRPINSEESRSEVLSALETVDYVVIFEEDTPIKMLSKIKPDIHVKGGDYDINQIVEKDIVEQNDGKVVLVPMIKGFSTTKIIELIKERY